MKNFSLFLLMLFAGIILITSCEKPADEESPTLATVEDDIFSELIYEDIFSEVESALNEMESILYDGFKKSSSEVVCRTVTVEHPDDSVFWPRTITIDYGEGCTGPNGVIRKGKIIILVTHGRVWVRDYSRTITFDDYYVDGRKIEGIKVVSNMGKNTNGNIVFSEVLTGGKVITPEENEITREFEREREWIAGLNTPKFRNDDEFFITGVTTGVDRKERIYTHTIVSPLHAMMSCRWIVAGSILFQVDELPEATLDYGDGECDRKATVTINGTTKEIILHR